MAEPSIIWPAGLPQAPRRSGYQKGVGSGVIRTSMEYGPAKTRRRGASPGTLTVSYILQEQACAARGGVNQKELFQEFFQIVDCALSFWLPNPENLAEYILVRITGEGEGAAFSLSPYAHKAWLVTLKLEVHPLVPTKPRI